MATQSRQFARLAKRIGARELTRYAPGQLMKGIEESMDRKGRRMPWGDTRPPSRSASRFVPKRLQLLRKRR